MKYYFIILLGLFLFPSFLYAQQMFPSDAVSIVVNMSPNSAYEINSNEWYQVDCDIYSEDPEFTVSGKPCLPFPDDFTLLSVKMKWTIASETVPVDSYAIVSCASNPGLYNYVALDSLTPSFESVWYGIDPNCHGGLFVQNTDPYIQARIWLTYVPRDMSLEATSTVGLIAEGFNSIILGLGILLVFCFIGFIGYIFNHIASKRPWQ